MSLPHTRRWRELRYKTLAQSRPKERQDWSRSEKGNMAEYDAGSLWARQMVKLVAPYKPAITTGQRSACAPGQ